MSIKEVMRRVRERLNSIPTEENTGALLSADLCLVGAICTPEQFEEARRLLRGEDNVLGAEIVLEDILDAEVIE